MNLQEFLQMGGYGAYVWSAYGLTAVVLMVNWWAARQREADELLSARRRTELQRESKQ